MEKIKFTERQIAAWRRIAMNVNSDVTKRNKLVEKRNELQEEISKLNRIIELNELPVKEATGGYTTSEIFVKTVTTTDKVDKDGRAVKTTSYQLRYPDTIVPVVETPNEEISGEHPSEVEDVEFPEEDSEESSVN
jgi:hypothetical protein